MKISRIEGAIDKSRLSVRHLDEAALGLRHAAIYYDDIPLWKTSAQLDELEIFLYDAKESDEEPYTLICVDQSGIHTYGSWWSIQAARDWLANPKKLYGKV